MIQLINKLMRPAVRNRVSREACMALRLQSGRTESNLLKLLEVGLFCGPQLSVPAAIAPNVGLTATVHGVEVLILSWYTF